MTNYEVYREFDSGLSGDDLEQAVERSGAAIEEMRGEGESISYLGSQVFVDEDEMAWATMCRYDATSEEAVRDLSERAELPVNEVFLRGTPLHGIAPKAGVARQTA